MLLLEYQAKNILRSVGIKTPPENLVFRNQDFNLQVDFPVAVKAQVHSGGRGKSGGVICAQNMEELSSSIDQLFHQKFNEEYPESLLIEPWIKIKKELYISVVVDQDADGYALIYSPDGGVDIENTENKIIYRFGALENFRPHQLRGILEKIESDFRLVEKIIFIGQILATAAFSNDCTTIEINPLALLDDEQLLALDAKIVCDDWASYRNQNILDFIKKEINKVHPLLRASLEMNHMYVQLPGDIGLISGGAGMTMAAMDMIDAFGGKPACFLDASPGPTSARGYKPALDLLEADERVKVILVSIFGGGTQMQRVAHAMKELLEDGKYKKPIVFRLDGTNIDLVPDILKSFGRVNFLSLEEAVKEAVRIAGSIE
jgi:succinyl-CoA synthetase beta subunit